MPIASVARSGLPILVTTSWTSGKRLIIRSISELMATDSDNDTLGSLRVSIRSEPSSSRGMNSVPIKNNEVNAVTTTIAAAVATLPRLGRTQSSSRA